MQAIRYIGIVGDDGLLQLRLAKPVGTKVEVFVLDLNEEAESDQSAFSKLQGATGFVKEILARSEEDVWNDV